LVFVAGGKWTTYREMAQDATDQVISLLSGGSSGASQSSSQSSGSRGVRQWRPCVTLTLPLEGREGWDPMLVVRLQQAVPGLPASQAQHLASTYGGHALRVLACTPKANATDVAHASAVEDEGVPVRGRLLVGGFPYVEQEVAWAARHEYCATAAAVCTYSFSLRQER
jgi:glycerol-3-phosphate dehydrogenase